MAKFGGSEFDRDTFGGGEENECQRGGFSRKDSPFSKKTLPFSRKDSPFSKQVICPVLLQENGWPIWTEAKEKLRLEKYK